jgi:hypothetical protein
LAGDSGYLVFDYLVGASGRTASIAAKALMQLAWLALLEVSQSTGLNPREPVGLHIIRGCC